MNKIFLIVLFIIFSAFNLFSLTDVDKQDLTGIKYNTNSGFENGIYGYTPDSGSTLSVETSIIHSGKKAGKFIGSATITDKKFQGPLNTIPEGLNCIALFYYKTASNDITASIYNNAGTLVSAVFPLTASVTYSRVSPISFSCPTGNTYRIRFTDTGITQVPFYVDDITLYDDPSSLPLTSLTSTRIPYVSTTKTLTDTSSLYWNNGSNTFNVKNQINLNGMTSGFVGFNVPNLAGSTVYTLPSADGSSTQALSTDGSATLSWRSYQLPLTNPVTGTGSSGTMPLFNGTSTITDGHITDNASLITTTLPTRINSAYTLPTTDGTTGYAIVTNGSGAASWTQLQTPLSITDSGSLLTTTLPLRINSAFTLPSADGNAGWGIATNGSGSLYWANFQTALSAAVNGTGTTNTVAKFTNTSDIGNSNITDTGTLISLVGNSSISNILFPNIYNDIQDPTGFIDRTAVLSFIDGTSTFSITGNHDIYINGIRSSKTTASNVLPTTEGLHWIYYNSSGALSNSLVSPGYTLPLIATVYWNNSIAKGLLAEERHGFALNHITHEYLHNSRGTAFLSGLPGTFTNTTFSIGTGSIADEDLTYTISVPQTNCSALFKNGSATFEWISPSTTPYHTVTGTIQYNNGNNLANVSANSYVAYWIYATNDITYPIISIMGQRQDNSIANARANNTPDLLSFGSYPYNEMKLLFRVIYRNVGGTPTFIEAADYRAVLSLPTNNYVASSHLTLTNLTNGDAGHTQFLELAGRGGGQIAYGSNLNSENLTLRSTSESLKGQVIIDETTDSNSLSSGAFKVLGGMAVNRNASIGSTLSLYGATSGNTSFIASATASGAYTLPSADGNANTFLSTNGSGTLSWANPSTALSTPGIQTANYAVQTADAVVLLNGLNNTVDATLYTCNAGNTGKHVWLKAIDTTNQVRVITGGENIDDSLNYVFPGEMSAIHVFCQTDTWYIISGY